MQQDDAMQLHPAMQAALDRLARQPFRPLADLDAAAARRQDAQLFDPLWNDGGPALAGVEDRRLAIGGGTVLAARRYDPGAAVPAGGAPALVYLHGGGFVLGGLDSHDSLCRFLALASGAVVVALDYRLAPEWPFPTPLLDCIAGLRALVAAAGDWGLDPARLAVGGDSAGAALALGCLLAAARGEAPPLRGGLLVYGMYGLGRDSDSCRRYGDGSCILSLAELDWFWRAYLAEPAAAADPRVELLSAELRGLPPLLVAAAEYDPLLDQSRLLAARLAAAGVPHRFLLWPGLTHAAFQMVAALPPVQDHIRVLGGHLRQALEPA